MTIEHDIFGGKPKAKGINSKRKGNTNELALTKFLNLWTGLEFQRVPSSGGLGWTSSVQTVGDVVCTTPDVVFPFTIETKHLKNIGLSSMKGIMLRSNSIIYTHWTQCIREGKAANKIPLFFVRDNGMKKNTWWVFMGERLGHELDISATYYGEYEGENLYGVLSTSLGKIDYNQLIQKL